MSTLSARQGQFISFEGIDGAGKSSHIGRLADWLRARGQVVTQTREPGGTPLAERLRELLLHERMDPLSEALLMFAARREHVLQVVRPALQRGEVVLCDRFTDASFAYQGFGRGFDLGVLTQLEAWVQGPEPLLQPDLTLWFDVPTEVAAARLASAREPDKFEAESRSFFDRVVAGYAQRAAQHPGRFVRLDSTQPLETVWAELLQVCVQRGVGQ